MSYVSHRLIPAVAALLLTVLLSGCGGSNAGGSGAKATATAVATATQDASAVATAGPGFAASAVANKLQLGSRQTAVLETLGEPAKRLSNAKFDCLVYSTDAGPDTYLRMCFLKGRMTGIGTIVGRASAFTLKVPETKGPGKVTRGKVVPNKPQPAPTVDPDSTP